MHACSFLHLQNIMNTWMSLVRNSGSEYHEYLEVSSKEIVAQFPKPKPRDHKIEMKEGIEPKSCKNYKSNSSKKIWKRDASDHLNL